MNNSAVSEVTETLARLTKDLKAAARLLRRREAQYLVKMYYQVQEFRLTVDNQIRSTLKLDEPNQLLDWLSKSFGTLENDIRRVLNLFAKEYRVGNWLQSICGIGPVISAGILAHLDVRNCKTAGHFMRYAGTDPTVKWMSRDRTDRLLTSLEEKVDEIEDLKNATKAEKQAYLARMITTTFGRNITKVEESMSTRVKLLSFLAKRPWNAELKTLLVFKAGESFVKVQNNENDFYGQHFVKVKAKLIEQNLAGKFSETAEEILASKKIGKDTDAYKSYVEGKLPPAHIHARARRWTAKLFVSHIHQVMYEDYYQEPVVRPYAFEYCPGDHRHFIAPPEWPGNHTGRSLKELLDN